MYESYMKSIKLSSIFSIFVMGIFFLFYSGCSGSSGSSSENKNYNIIGEVQKGIFLGGEIHGQKLDEEGKVLGEISKVIIDSNGKYTLEVNTTGLWLLTARGIFFNEYTGENSDDEVELYVLINLKEDKKSYNINLNLFSSFEYKRVKVLLTEGFTYEEALSQAKIDLMNEVGLSKNVNASDLDIYDLNGTLKEENFNLLLFSGTLLKIIEKNVEKVSKLSNLGLRGRTNDLLKRMYEDVGDNGRFDGKAKEEFGAMQDDDEVLTFGTLGQNLGFQSDFGLTLGLGWKRKNPRVSPPPAVSPAPRVSPLPRISPPPIEPPSLLNITEFSFKSVILNKIERNSTSADTEIYIGSESDNSELKVFLSSTYPRRISYTVKIYAEVEGRASLLLVNNEVISPTLGTKSRRQSKYILIPFSTSFQSYVEQAYDNNKSVKLKVVASTVENGIRKTKIKISDALPQFRGLHKNIMHPRTLIESSLYLGECEGLNPKRYLKMNIIGKYRNSANITYSDVCVNINYSSVYKEYTVVLANGIGTLDKPYRRTLGGMDVDIFTTSIDSNKEEIEKIVLKLPPHHSIHSRDGQGNILPRGENIIVLDNPENNIINQNTNSLDFSGSLTHKYLHIKNLPFYFELDNYEMGDDRWIFSNAKVKYLFNYANDKFNNSERFKEPLNQSVTLTLVNEGVSTQNNLQFASADILTHYPQLSETSAAFEVGMLNSQLTRPITSSFDSSLNMPYSPECRSMGCTNGNSSEKFTLSSIVSTKFYADGSSVSKQVSKIGEVTWGTKDGDKVFKRMDDVGAKVFIPGFELPTNEVEEVSAYLLGTIEDNDAEQPIYHKVDETVSKIGKHLFAGVNVGDFTSKGLDGKSMTLLIADKQNLTLTSHGYSKYYIRPSGVTGVFNNKGEIPSLNIYGYLMNLDQFKFRQINNVLEDYSKIDGSVHVEGKGNFTVNFNSLGLDCRGNLNKGVVAEEQVDSKLTAWKMATTFTTIGFEGEYSRVCSSDRKLLVGHALKVAALKDKLGAEIKWSSEGVPLEATVVASAMNQLDGNRSKDDALDNGGYDIHLGSMKLASLATHDWLESNVTFGLPFWGATDMSVRLVNKDLTTREPSVVVKEGALSTFNMDQINDNIAKAISDSYRQTVSTKWANILPFGFPVYYDSKVEGDKTPQFLGRTWTQDLIVMEASAGVDYITPDKTSMSFGASANFEQLQGMKLHIDLNDPESIREIDKSLYDAHLRIDGTKTPLWDTVGVLVSTVHIGNTFLKEGLTKSMEEGAVLALSTVSHELEEKDPFEYLAKLNAEVYAIPMVVHNKFEKELFTGIEQLLKDVDTDEIAKVQKEMNKRLKEYDAFVSYLEETKAILISLNSIENLIGEATQYIPNTDEIPLLDQFIAEKTFGGETCNWDNFSTKGFFKPVGEVTNAVAKVNKELQGIKIEKIAKFAKKANEFTGLNSDSLVFLAKSIQITSAYIDDLANDQENWVHDQFNPNNGSICVGFNTMNQTLTDTYSTLGFNDELKNDIITTIDEILVLLKDNEEIQAIKKRLNSLSTEDTEQLKEDFELYIGTQVLEKTRPLIEKVQLSIPNLTADDMRRVVVTKIFELDMVHNMVTGINERLQPVADELNRISSVLFSGLDKNINKILSKVNAKVNAALAKSTSTLDKIPLKTASMDGYAVFYGDSLYKLHVGSEFKVSGKDKDSSFSFNAALDIENDDARGSSGCSGTKNRSNLHAAISTRNISMPIGSKKLKVDLILLGVTISPEGKLKGIFGAISSKGGFNVDKFKLYNLGLDVGIGADETYLGARANATLDDLQLGMSYLVGRVCNPKVMERLLPKSILEFITIPNGKFNGAMIFGEAQVPVWVNGCALTVNAKAKLGLWFLFGPPKTFGGLVGGGAYGKALCIATLGGEIEILAEKSGDVVQFQGSGWGAAGVGSCDNSWSSVSNSRSDSWCGTGDAQFGARYRGGWELTGIKTSAVH